MPLLTALALAAASGCAAGAAGERGAAHAVSDHPLVGSAAPALELPTPNGKSKVTLSAHAGKVVVVDFWATWCEPCRDSFRAYQSLLNEFSGKVVVLAVSVDESPDDIGAFVKSTGAKFPVAWDEGQSAARSYEPPTMPSSFIVDRHGIVRFVHAGFNPGDERALRDELRSLLWRLSHTRWPAATLLRREVLASLRMVRLFSHHDEVSSKPVFNDAPLATRRHSPRSSLRCYRCAGTSAPQRAR